LLEALPAKKAGLVLDEQGTHEACRIGTGEQRNFSFKAGLTMLIDLHRPRAKKMA